MKKLLLISLLMTFFLSSFSQSESYSIISREGITIEYPSNWYEMEIPSCLILVKERAPTDHISVITNFVVEIDENYSSIEKYTEAWKEKMFNNEHSSNFKLISERDIIYKGFDAREFICTYEFSTFKAKTKVIIFVFKDKIINLNTTSSEDSFSRKNEITEKIYNSVKIFE
ncbi:MAG: hypothetical protein K8R54_15335 [Bacteroidales bacterium]|nr:hypothetical protein [Bacteroidales bacterium]